MMYSPRFLTVSKPLPYAKMPVADLSVETKLFGRGISLLAGMDEVGRGPLAGPVTVGVTVIDAATSLSIEGLTDSKSLSAKKRLTMVPEIRRWALTAVAHASAPEIDKLGINTALRLAAQRALAQVVASGAYPEAILLDGQHNWLADPQKDLLADLDPAYALYRDLVAEAWQDISACAESGWCGPVQMEIKGDLRCASIAAASVVAKVERDQRMLELDRAYPGYGWAQNKGYGSASHRRKIMEHGPTPVHRLSWSLPATDEQLRAALREREKDHR